MDNVTEVVETVTESAETVPVVLEPKTISLTQEFIWNFTEIKTAVASHIEKYCGLVVTDQNLPDMEKAQKEVANIRIKLDGFRKEVKKTMEEPYKKFELEIKELQKLITQAEDPLKDQISVYEKQRVKNRETELTDFANTTAVSMGVRNEYFKFAIDSKWTNRGAKILAVKKEIITEIETMLVAQKRDDEIIKMKRQRIQMIESLCVSLSAAKLLKTPIVPEDVNYLLEGVELSQIMTIIGEAVDKRRDMEIKAAMPPEITLESIMPSEWIPEQEIELEYIPETQRIEYIPVPPPPPDTRNYPPMPPVSRQLPPMPPSNNHAVFVPPPLPVIQLWNADAHFYGITVKQAEELKAYMTKIGITYKFDNYVEAGVF